MITAQVTARVKQALIEKNAFERDLFKVVLGDLQMAATRKGADLTEAEEQGVVKSMVKSLNETLANAEGAAADTARAELEILEALLPKSMSEDEVRAALEPAADAVKAAPSDGAATGVAMKHLKQAAGGAAIDGKVVAAVVKDLRSE